MNGWITNGLKICFPFFSDWHTGSVTMICCRRGLWCCVTRGGCGLFVLIQDYKLTTIGSREQHGTDVVLDCTKPARRRVKMLTSSYNADFHEWDWLTHFLLEQSVLIGNARTLVWISNIIRIHAPKLSTMQRAVLTILVRSSVELLTQQVRHNQIFNLP